MIAPAITATRVLINEIAIVQFAAFSSDLRLSPSATSRESVEFFTHDEASFCR